MILVINTLDSSYTEKEASDKAIRILKYLRVEFKEIDVNTDAIANTQTRHALILAQLLHPINGVYEVPQLIAKPNRLIGNIEHITYFYNIGLLKQICDNKHCAHLIQKTSFFSCLYPPRYNNGFPVCFRCFHDHKPENKVLVIVVGGDVFHHKIREFIVHLVENQVPHTILDGSEFQVLVNGTPVDSLKNLTSLLCSLK